MWDTAETPYVQTAPAQTTLTGMCLALRNLYRKYNDPSAWDQMLTVSLWYQNTLLMHSVMLIPVGRYPR
jgi:hypothetical protein